MELHLIGVLIVLNLLFLKQVLLKLDVNTVMAVVANKILYKIELYLLKIIPMLLAICNLMNTILSYFGFDVKIFTYIVGIGILPIIFLYISSYVFKFCSYHRMFLHYIVVNNVLCYIDYEYGINISDKDYLSIHLIIAGIFLFTILYLKQKLCKYHYEKQ